VVDFCIDSDACNATADCSPNHVCEAYFDHGFSVCVDDPNPTCIIDAEGACRFACKTDADCTQGGGCASDGLCHASNECHVDADCASGLICYANPTWVDCAGPSLM